jgi:hypothetical protein
MMGAGISVSLFIIASPSLWFAVKQPPGNGCEAAQIEQLPRQTAAAGGVPNHHGGYGLSETTVIGGFTVYG